MRNLTTKIRRIPQRTARIMAKYVDADDLKNKLISSGAICGFGQYLIDIQPAADVRPERHGYYEKSHVSTETGYTTYKCSICGFSIRNNLPRQVHNSPTNRYCPMCGAKMDGDANADKNTCDGQ